MIYSTCCASQIDWAPATFSRDVRIDSEHTGKLKSVALSGSGVSVFMRGKCLGCIVRFPHRRCESVAATQNVPSVARERELILFNSQQAWRLALKMKLTVFPRRPSDGHTCLSMFTTRPQPQHQFVRSSGWRRYHSRQQILSQITPRSFRQPEGHPVTFKKSNGL